MGAEQERASLKGTVAFTGRLASMKRAEAFEHVRRHGGTPRRGVTKGTSLLVVGELGWPLLADGRPSNSLAQAREFTSAVGVTGLILTKLDGTAKGGIVVSISRELSLPIRFVGTGEQINDLVPFDSETYVNSLFD